MGCVKSKNEGAVVHEGNQPLPEKQFIAIDSNKNSTHKRLCGENNESNNSVATKGKEGANETNGTNGDNGDNGDNEANGDNAANGVNGQIGSKGGKNAQQKALSNKDIDFQLNDGLPEKSSTSFEDEYRLGKTIGSGTFSVVREGFHRKTNYKYAIKCIKRDGLSVEDIEALTAEVAILKQMNHPNIMILHDFFSEEKYYYLVTEYMEGGELFDRIVEKSYYSEREARDLVKLLLEAISYCHKSNVVHRDLKPENLLLKSKEDNASIKIADFGFAKRIDFDGEGLNTACGTPGYVAPEILHGKTYGKAVDIWSIGVITYILLCGYPPFHDENHNALFRKIKRGKFEFDSPYWDNISQDAKDLILKMLVVNQSERAGADSLLRHPWLCNNEVATVQLTSALEELRRFNARRKFKAAVNTVQAANLLTRVRKLSSNVSSPRHEQSAERPVTSQKEKEMGSGFPTVPTIPTIAETSEIYKAPESAKAPEMETIPEIPEPAKTAETSNDSNSGVQPSGVPENS